MEGYLEQGEVTKTSLDENGEVVCSIILPGDEVIHNVRLRLPPGFQAMPVDDKDGHDASIWRDGRLKEVMAAVDRDVTASLPKLKKAQTRIHSLEQGGAAQLISILMNEILLGKNAQQGVVRLGDHVDAGKITLIATPNPPLPAPPTFTITITYTDVDGTVSAPFGPLPFVGVSINAGAGGTVVFNLRGKTIEASQLVKAE